jgi:hypothetical protein
MDEREERTDHYKRCGRKEQYSPWSHQSPEVHSKGSDEHQSHVKRRADPRAVIETNSEMALEIG